MAKKDSKDIKASEGSGAKRKKPNFRKKIGLKIKFLVVSGKDEMKLSRTVDAILEEVTQSTIVFKSNSMIIDELHLSYNESPMLRNRLILEMDFPQYNHKVKALGEVSWYERSLVSKEPVFHIGVNLIEISEEDREVIKKFLVDSKMTKEAIRLT